MKISPAPAEVAVAFDFGQTLCDLDTGLLSSRLAERGLVAGASALDGAMDSAWRAYNAAIAAGVKGHPWRELMRTLIRESGARTTPAGLETLIDWLWSEQPRRNLWRRPVPGMLEMVHTLSGLRRSPGAQSDPGPLEVIADSSSGPAAEAIRAPASGAAPVKLALISNSEGHIAKLATEVGLAEAFDVIADSFLVGVDKPDPAIFHWTAQRLGLPVSQLIYVGDSWAADVQGALGAGCRAAIWFRGNPDVAAGDENIICAQSASEVAAALTALGVPLGLKR